MKEQFQWRDTEILISVIISIGCILLLAGLGATAQQFEGKPEMSHQFIHRDGGRSLI